MIDTLLTGDPAGRLRCVGEVLSRADAPARVEAALPDLLRDGDEPLLEAVAQGLARFPDEVAARRVLEVLARRGGRVRAAALTSLRGALGEVPVDVRATTPGPPPPAQVESAPVATAPDAGGPSAPASAPAWDAPFEALLTAPSAAGLSEAALALMELSEQRPAAATREALQALAGRLAMASFDHEGELQAGLARLAKGLKALA